MLKKYKTDIFVVIALLILSIIVQEGRLGFSINGTYVTTDVANYASMSAADDHPEAFVRDPAYNDVSRYGVHATSTTSLVNFLAHGENYGLAYLKLTGIQFFLHGLAFYLLGIVLLKKRWQAALFTLLMAQIYWMHWGTYWGNGHIDYTPRSTFAALYPFFIIAALHILHKPRWWPVFLAAMGTMVHVHSISTLPTAFGFWLGFALCRPQNVSMKKHLLWLFFSGCCFILAIIPFALSYIRPGIELSSDDVALLREILRIRYNIENTEYWIGLRDFLLHYTLLPLFPLGIASFYVLRRIGTEEEKILAAQFAMWAVGVLFCGSLFFIDHEIAHATGRHPYEFDIARVFRFWIFFSMCLTFLAINSVFRHIPKENIWGRRTAGFLWFAFFMGLFLGGQMDKVRESFLWFWNKADTARYEEAYASDLQREAMLNALQKHTPIGALIYDPEGDRAIRYKALRSLVYSWKDSSIYYYPKDMQGLRHWYKHQKGIKSSPTAYIQLALDSKADYILSHRPQDREILQNLGSIVWESPHYLLLQVGS